MTETDYAPFPEGELLRLAEFHESVAKGMQSAFLAGVHTDRANACRNAVKAHDALRERFLEQSMTVRELQAKQEAA